MVKRKAEISLDEWLEWAPVPSEVIDTSTNAAANSEVPKPNSTTATSLSEVKVEAAVNTPADVAPTESDTHEWFWLLLKQSGYERW